MTRGKIWQGWEEVVIFGGKINKSKLSDAAALTINLLKMSWNEHCVVCGVIIFHLLRLGMSGKGLRPTGPNNSTIKQYSQQLWLSGTTSAQLYSDKEMGWLIQGCSSSWSKVILRDCSGSNSPCNTSSSSEGAHRNVSAPDCGKSLLETERIISNFVKP